MDVVRGGLDRFQTELTDPALLETIGACDGLRVLDAGCGEGYLTRALVRRGAEFVHGVDTCAEFAAAARSHPEAHPQTSVFHLADVADLPVADRSVDLVVANRLPHGIIEPGKRFREFARVLRPSGRLIVLSMHPCFYVARADRNRPEARGFDLDAYFGTRTVEQRSKSPGRPRPQRRCRRSSAWRTTCGCSPTPGSPSPVCASHGRPPNNAAIRGGGRTSRGRCSCSWTACASGSRVLPIGLCSSRTGKCLVASNFRANPGRGRLGPGPSDDRCSGKVGVLCGCRGLEKCGVERPPGASPFRS